MKWILLVLGLVVMGCDQTQTTGSCGDAIVDNDAPGLNDGGTENVVAPDDGGSGGAGGNGAPAVDPCAPYTSSILPAMGLGDVQIVCSQCGDTCEPLGEVCGAYGAPCDFNGNPGVCISCCALSVGELHCSPL